MNACIAYQGLKMQSHKNWGRISAARHTTWRKVFGHDFESCSQNDVVFFSHRTWKLQVSDHARSAHVRFACHPRVPVCLPDTMIHVKIQQKSDWNHGSVSYLKCMNQLGALLRTHQFFELMK